MDCASLEFSPDATVMKLDKYHNIVERFSRFSAASARKISSESPKVNSVISRCSQVIVVKETHLKSFDGLNLPRSMGLCTVTIMHISLSVRSQTESDKQILMCEPERNKEMLFL